MHLPPLHLVTDDRVLAGPGWVARAEAALEAGGPAVALHVRGPGTGARELPETVTRLRGPSRRLGAALVVNDRLDVALAAGADAVQLGGRSLPLDMARRILDPSVRVGASVHDAGEARAARSADWLVVGTLWASRSHPGRNGAGPSLLAAVAAAAPGVPLVGIGGVTPDRVSEALAAGARGVAVLSGVWDAADPAEAVARYRRALAAYERDETRTP